MGARLVVASALLVAVVALAGCTVGAPLDRASSETTTGIGGATGVGDPYFPLAGNSGIDVTHYGLAIRFQPAAEGSEQPASEVDATATIDLVATEDLEDFTLDLDALSVSSVTVDGRPARYLHEEGELRVTPAADIDAASKVVVVVDYSGRITSPDMADSWASGWISTSDGAVVASEPVGASSWFPCNDHPSDRATFDFAITVPSGSTAIANGVLLGHETHGDATTWRWRASDELATYLATATIGSFTIEESTTSDGIRIINAIDDSVAPEAYHALTWVDDILDFYAQWLGPYPFEAFGAIVDDDDIGYALETQTRPFFSREASEAAVAHEAAHQWFGDDVTVQDWSDIWLNEGWATYAEWRWGEHRGMATMQKQFEAVMSRETDDSWWNLDISDPGADEMFANQVYDRGAALLFALDQKIGRDDFDRLAREWVTGFGGHSASTEDFVALAEEVSGERLDTFFALWLSSGKKPESW